jgi:hypothetical protein
MPPGDQELGDWLSLDMLLADGSMLPFASALGKSVDISSRICESGATNPMRESVDAVRGKNYQFSGEDFASCKSSRGASPEALSCRAETESLLEALILPKMNTEKASVAEMKDRPMAETEVDIFSGGFAELAVDKKLLDATDGSANGSMSDMSHYSTGDEDQRSTDMPSQVVKVNGDDGSPNVPPSSSGSTSENGESKSNAKATNSQPVIRWMGPFNDNAEPPTEDQSIASRASNNSAARDDNQASESHDGSHVDSPLRQFMKRSKGERDVAASQENVKTASRTNERSTPKSSPKSSTDQKRPKKLTGFQNWLAQLNTEHDK